MKFPANPLVGIFNKHSDGLSAGTKRWDDVYRDLHSKYVKGQPPSDVRALLLMSDYPNLNGSGSHTAPCAP